MQGTIFHAALALLLLTLAACTTAPPLPAVDGGERAFRERLAELAAYEEWGLSGRVSVRVDDRGWHAALDWRQRDDGYRLNLFGPFGRGLAQIDADGSGVTMTTEDERVVTAADADELVYRELGWPLPVGGLRDWILGRPAAGAGREYEITIDSWGRPGWLRQDGWEIEYRRYDGDLCPTMPDRLRLTRDGVTVTIVVDEWRFGR